VTEPTGAGEPSGTSEPGGGVPPAGVTGPGGATKPAIDVAAIVAVARRWLTSRKPVFSFNAGQRPVTVEQRHLTWTAAVLVVVLVVVALGGGGGGGSANSPTGAVQQVFRLVEAGQFDKVPDMACTAYKSQAAQAFDFGSAFGSLMPGMTTQQVASAIHIVTSDLSITEVSRSGDKAVVKVSGTMKLSVDATKFREVIKSLLGAAGQSVDDSVIDATMSQLTGLMNSTQPLDSTLNVVNEGGSWKICQ
jgi:hypothetical protein